MRLVINFRKQETNIPLTSIFIYTVQTKSVQCIPPPPPHPPQLLQITLGGKKKEKTKEKKCVIYFVHVCTSKKTFYWTKIVKEAGTLFLLMSEVTDIPLSMRKYCIIKKGKSQTGHWADFIQAFLVLSVCNTRDTDLWRNIMHNLKRSCHPVNLCLIFMYTRDVKLSFPNNSIKKFTLWSFTLYVTILTSFQENDPYI